MKYRITVPEITLVTFEIEATSKHEALKIFEETCAADLITIDEELIGYDETGTWKIKEVK